MYGCQIREISSLLLDIHGQHEHQSLLYQDQQLIILDAYGKEEIREKKQEVRERFSDLESEKEGTDFLISWMRKPENGRFLSWNLNFRR